MKFTQTPLRGAYTIELEKRGDERGFFARAFCTAEFDKYGLDTRVVQANDSLSAIPGTLRGMHLQLPPHTETKIIRCIKGRLYDVIVDLRADSPTFCQWFGVELSADNRVALYVPRGFAHGFVTLEPDTEAFYLVSEFYASSHERGVRWDDPAFGIQWPVTPVVISEKDKAHVDFSTTPFGPLTASQWQG